MSTLYKKFYKHKTKLEILALNRVLEIVCTTHLFNLFLTYQFVSDSNSQVCGILKNKDTACLLSLDGPISKPDHRWSNFSAQKQ